MPNSTHKNIVVFYDDPCIDGATCAWIIREKYKSEPGVSLSFVPLGYGEKKTRTQRVLSHLHNGDEAIFVDTTPKDDTLEFLFCCDGTSAPLLSKLTIIDHHATEVGRLHTFEQFHKTCPDSQCLGTPPELELILDPTAPSAAQVAWRHFFPEAEEPHFLELLGLMDAADLKTHTDYALAAFFDAQDITSPEAIFETISSLVRTSAEDVLSQGSAILADQLNVIKKNVKNSFNYAKMELLEGRTFWVPLVNLNVQNAGRRVNGALLEEATAGTTCGVVGAWHHQGDGTVKLSLRSNGVPDVGKIADYLKQTIASGGGGKPSLAAVQFENLLSFVKAVPLYTKEQMIAEIWREPSKPTKKTKQNGTHKPKEP